jgi:hypothetical protein
MKRTISAKEFLADARAGLTDLGLMDKYDLGMPTVQALFRKLVECGLMSAKELEERLPLTERSVTQKLYRCPACKMPQFSEFDECPQCGVIVSKLFAVSQTSDPEVVPQETTREAVTKPPEPLSQDFNIGYEPFAESLESLETAAAPNSSFQALDAQLPSYEPARRPNNTIKISVLIPTEILNELNGLGGELSEHVTEAVKTYLAELRKAPIRQQ